MGGGEKKQSPSNFKTLEINRLKKAETKIKSFHNVYRKLYTLFFA